MSRMQRVKDAIHATRLKNEEMVKKSLASNKIPNDYSLGFCNGIIFCDHYINMRPDKPDFYERTTAIGSLPKPVVLLPGPLAHIRGAEEVFMALRETVILSVRNMIKNPSDAACMAVEEALVNHDTFIEELAAKAQISLSPDAGSAGQEGSIPSAAPETKETMQ